MSEGSIASVIIKFNRIESQLKEVISEYTSSDKDYFVNEVLLNNSTINFHNKRKILKHIIRETGLEIAKDFNDGIEYIAKIRNQVAHSDRLNNIEIVDSEYDREGSQTPIYGLDPLIIEKDGEVRLMDKIADFNRYYNIVTTELEKISAIIKAQRVSNKPESYQA